MTPQWSHNRFTYDHASRDLLDSHLSTQSDSEPDIAHQMDPYHSLRHNNAWRTPRGPRVSYNTLSKTAKTRYALIAHMGTWLGNSVDPQFWSYVTKITLNQVIGTFCPISSSCGVHATKRQIWGLWPRKAYSVPSCLTWSSTCELRSRTPQNAILPLFIMFTLWISNLEMVYFCDKCISSLAQYLKNALWGIAQLLYVFVSHVPPWNAISRKVIFWDFGPPTWKSDLSARICPDLPCIQTKPPGSPHCAYT